MNLEKLFETQKELRDRINYNGEDRFNKLILALLVELGECANEWRGFKFWSKDQEPRTVVPSTGWGEPYTNPLLEEYVDGLHFVLELGIELGYKPSAVRSYIYTTVARQFKELYWEISDLDKSSKRDDYIWVFQKFIGLGKMLGFTWEQVEQAYYDKNKINHIRQDTGY